MLRSSPKASILSARSSYWAFFFRYFIDLAIRVAWRQLVVCRYVLPQQFVAFLRCHPYKFLVLSFMKMLAELFVRWKFIFSKSWNGSYTSPNMQEIIWYRQCEQTKQAETFNILNVCAKTTKNIATTSTYHNDRASHSLCALQLWEPVPLLFALSPCASNNTASEVGPMEWDFQQPHVTYRGRCLASSEGPSFPWAHVALITVTFLHAFWCPNRRLSAIGSGYPKAWEVLVKLVAYKILLPSTLSSDMSWQM